MNRGLFSFVVPASLIASLILLAGCTIVVEPFDPVTRPVSASADPLSPVQTVTLGSSEEVWYEVSVSSNLVSSSDVIYFEAEPQGFADTSGVLSLRLYASSGTVLASSVSPAGFGAGTTTLTSASASEFSPAIVNAVNCRGPCIILPSASGTFLIRVRNISGSTITVNFFAFGDQFADGNEPFNDSEQGAVGLVVNDEDTGAIETLGDVDWYVVNERGTFLFTSLSSAELRAEVWDGSVLVDTLSPGESVEVRVGDEIAVFSAGNFAGPPGSDGQGTFYTVELRP
jgi:hypothetical protein